MRYILLILYLEFTRLIRKVKDRWENTTQLYRVSRCTLGRLRRHLYKWKHLRTLHKKWWYLIQILKDNNSTHTKERKAHFSKESNLGRQEMSKHCLTGEDTSLSEWVETVVAGGKWLCGCVKARSYRILQSVTRGKWSCEPGDAASFKSCSCVIRYVTWQNYGEPNISEQKRVSTCWPKDP